MEATFPTERLHPQDELSVLIYASGREDGVLPPCASIATGFYVVHEQREYLVTNLHVIYGETPTPKKRDSGLFIIKELFVRHPGDEHPKRLSLFNEEKPVWLEHPKEVSLEGHNQMIDIALIPISRQQRTGSIDLQCLNIPHIPYPLDHVCIVGFPFIRDRPIWKTGHVAETVGTRQKYFLVNSRTKSGMSGSPVLTKSISLLTQTNLPIGIYSGRFKDHEVSNPTAKDLNELDLAVVWKFSLLHEIIEHAENTCGERLVPRSYIAYNPSLL